MRLLRMVSLCSIVLIHLIPFGYGVALAQEVSSPNPGKNSLQIDEFVAQHVVAGHAVRLISNEGQPCQLQHKLVASQATPGIQDLMLRSPCYLLIWQTEPPAKKTGHATGIPVGNLGSPIAWRYASAKNAVVLAVIGDPIPDSLLQSQLYRLREEQNMHCAGSVQGILIRADKISFSPVRRQVGVQCVEAGIDEKDFWLLAHPR